MQPPLDSSWSRLSDIVLDLIEADEDERQRILDQLSPADRDAIHPYLSAAERPFEVPEAWHEAVQNFIGLRPVDFPVGPEWTIDKYRVVEHIADGGTSAVYRAVEPTTGRSRAVKVMAPEAADAFRREAGILSDLKHPNIVWYRDAGDLVVPLPPEGASEPKPSEVYFCVTDYVDGQDIVTYCQDRDLGLGDRVALMVQVADALQTASDNQVVHGDLKPVNILTVEEPGTVGRPVVVDFGEASTGIGDNHRRSSRGTPAYAAPEQ